MNETKKITAIVTQEDADHVSEIVQAYINYLISSENLISNYIEHRSEIQYEAFLGQYRNEMFIFIRQVMDQLDELSVMNGAKWSSEQLRNAI